MSAALQELESFSRFAEQHLATGGAKLTLEEYVRMWREQQATVDDIQQRMVDYDNGLAQPLAEAFDDVRRRLGIGR